ncbi:MAG: aspartate aminotransferase family protein [Actinomycetota bacterium]
MASSHGFETAPHEYCPFMPVFAPPRVMFERGSGTELWDVEGRRYLDFLSGIAVVSLGHANAVVAKAVSEQMNRLLHVSNFFANPVATTAAADIDALLAEVTGHQGQVFLCNSGAEANEAAIKLARKFGGRGRHTVISAYGSFHGRTLATLAATGQPAKHEPFQPMPEGFRHVAYGDLAALEAAIDQSVAAVLLESIQGEGGVVEAGSEYLSAVRRLCDEAGILMMVDEVQTGLARTGRWFGFESDLRDTVTPDVVTSSRVTPDVVTMAKALGNGFPVGACWAKREIAAVFRPGDHVSTYSGTAIAGAAISAVIAEMRRIDAPRLAREQGAYTANVLSSIPGVEAVRGQGLLLAVELGPLRNAKAVNDELLARGMIANAVTASALRIAPPLTVTRDEVDEFSATLWSVLADGIGVGS